MALAIGLCHRVFTVLNRPGWDAPLQMGDNSEMLVDGANTPQAPANGGDPRAVLIVEDSENSASLLEIAFLQIPGREALLASSAFEALRILRRPGPAVRAIVTDFNMPRMDGFEMIRAIREDRALSST